LPVAGLVIGMGATCAFMIGVRITVLGARVVARVDGCSSPADSFVDHFVLVDALVDALYEENMQQLYRDRGKTLSPPWDKKQC
jgi:hypothetical protein